LVRAPRLADALGLPEESLYLKLEGSNPTGSFKDRGMTLAVSKALEEKASAVVCASTGNTAASAAAYAARAGLRCLVFLPRGKVALGKLSQAGVHGAEIFQIRGNFDSALGLVRKLSLERGWTLVNSLNPHRLEGQKTAAWEIIETLGRAPDYQFLPVGNAGNITAYWKGYTEFIRSKFRPAGGLKPFRLPRMMGFQAEGAAPIVLGHAVKNPETVATAIRIGNPASWKGAVQAREESGGVIDTVTDSEILEAYHLVACLEGVFCEPASAAGVAGLKKYVSRKWFSGPKELTSESKVVCILTGHGLKDPGTAVGKRIRIPTLPPSLKAFKKHLP